MIGRKPSRSILAICIGASMAFGREWKSADAKRSFEAAFVAIKGDKILLATPNAKPAAYPLAAFSKEDQQFAENAQTIADAAAKMGRQSFEITQATDDGWLCRMALPPSGKPGPTLFTGETFFLIPADPKKGKPGMQFDGQLLFGAGGRTLYPLKGEPSPIRAFCTDAESAAKIWMETVGAGGNDPSKQSPPVIEPEIKIVTHRSIGLALTKDGMVLAGSQLAKDADTLAVRISGKDEPATVVKADDQLGVALISCKAPLQPGRFGARKPVELGQVVLAVSMEISALKKSIGPPTITRGIVSRLQGSGGDGFQHDATVPPENLGGYVVAEKGDVLGVFFPPIPADKGKSAALASAQDRGLATCIRTDTLSGFLMDTPAAGALKSAPTSSDFKEITQSLRESSVLVVATREVRTVRDITSKARTPPPGGPVTGFSLSLQGVRHNSTCRFYAPLRPCGPNDGRPCKTCGG